MFPVSKMLIFNLFLVLFVTKVCQAEKPLTCYICDDCKVVDKNTPMEVCDEEFFNLGGLTSSSVMTTVAPTATTTVTAEPDPSSTTTVETSTETETTTTSMETSEMTTELVIESEKVPPQTPDTMVSSTPTPTFPTPPALNTTQQSGLDVEVFNEMKNETNANQTVQQNGALLEVSTATTTTNTPMTSTTIAGPTSASVMAGLFGEATNETVVSSTEPVSDLDMDQVGVTKMYMPSSSFRTRSARSIHARNDQQITYHCFKLEKSVNGSQVTQRGCARVSAQEDVCEQVKQNVTATKCKACSTPKCNSSSAVQVSAAALIFALIACFLHYK